MSAVPALNAGVRSIASKPRYNNSQKDWRCRIRIVIIAFRIARGDRHQENDPAAIKNGRPKRMPVPSKDGDMKHLTMRRSFLASTALSVAGGVALGAPSLAFATSSDDTADLQATANEFLRALDNLDWEALQEGLAAEPSVFFPFNDTPERVDGKSAVGERFRAFFKQVKQKVSGPPYLKLEPQNLKVTRYGDAGLISFTLGGLKSVGGLSGSIGRRTILFVLEDGKWKVAHLHASSAGV